MTKDGDVKKQIHTNICMMKEDLVDVLDSSWAIREEEWYILFLSFLNRIGLDWIGLIELMLRTFEIGIYKSSDLLFPNDFSQDSHFHTHTRVALFSLFSDGKWMDPHWDYFGARTRVQGSVCIAVIYDNCFSRSTSGSCSFPPVFIGKI